MNTLAVKIPVIESEAGWGRKIDDYMVCLSVTDAKDFEKEFNSKNTAYTTPSWYMQVEGEPIPIELTTTQMKRLKKEKRIWFSELKEKQ